MHAYSQVLLSELHIDPNAQSLTTSRRAAERYALLQAVQAAAPSRPLVRLPIPHRLLGLVRRAQRSPA